MTQWLCKAGTFESMSPETFPMLITPAFAQAAGAAPTSSLIVSMLPFLLIFVIMYFLIIRPQQKRVKQHQELIKNVRRGDTIVTSGGIIGKISKVTDDSEIQVEIADNVRVRVARAMIAEVRTKGEPVKDEAPVS
jgi:preprotein translocase subunit YajC